MVRNYLAEPKVVHYGTKAVPVGVDYDEADAYGNDDRHHDLERHDDEQRQDVASGL